MSSKIISGALLALLVAAPGRLTAGGLEDHCIVRSMEENGGAVRITADVDRSEVDDHLRKHAQSVVVQSSGVQLSDVKLGKIQWTLAAPTTLGVVVDVEAKVQVGRSSVKLGGTVGGQVKLKVVDVAAVHAELFLDKLVIPASQIRLNDFVTLNFKGLTVQLPSTSVAGFTSQFQLPGTSGRLQSVSITSVDPSWFQVVIDVRP
jgi:hypothetical protein